MRQTERQIVSEPRPAKSLPAMKQTVRRAANRGFGLLAAALVAAVLGGCACRPGYVGPYGGVHPGRCFVG